VIQGNNWVVHVGNNLDILPTLPDNSVDSIVTDPPYELGFMGKKWDNSGIAYNVELWKECLRVLKPGGHLLSFGGTRTWHRVAVAIEDAGFEVRDSIAWMYGSGFPKSLDVAKAIDKQAGYEGTVIGTESIDVGMQGGSMHAGRERRVEEREIKELSPEAKQWEGWGTALKPAFEPIVVARKPLIGTVAENVLTYGTGALNIDASRIGFRSDNDRKNAEWGSKGSADGWGMKAGAEVKETNDAGRWPANVILDEYSAELLDEQSGISTSKSSSMKVPDIRGGKYGSDYGTRDFDSVRGHKDSGGASRFFYVAKASKRDRNEGLDDLPTVRASAMGYDIGLGEAGEGMFKDRNPQKQNFHPTVKPTELMKYLIKLVTPPNGTVLDPFTGSGSTGKAALLEGFSFIGIEMTEDYIPIIEGRLKNAEQKIDEGLF
jgi:DNA modification methylase